MVTDPEQANGTSASQANSDQRNALALLGSAPLATFGTITRGEEQTACRAVAPHFPRKLRPLKLDRFSHWHGVAQRRGIRVALAPQAPTRDAPVVASVAARTEFASLNASTFAPFARATRTQHATCAPTPNPNPAPQDHSANSTFNHAARLR